jgi:aminoglycoside phosphotransferase family enzyme/predicted kinase
VGFEAVQAFGLFDEICRAMADPSFYPHRVTNLERRDTHISTVFLTGDWVYKLKKPVDFGFLDFRELDARRRFCEQEVALNRRLSQGVYQGVVGICEDDAGRLSLEGDGKVVEYAVKMLQLPDEASLEALLRAGRIDRGRLEDLGCLLADFYAASQRSPQIDQFGSLETITFNVEENFRQLEPFIDDLSIREKWDLICQVNRSFIKIWQDLFRSRITEGRVRDCHGDLRAEHIYFHRGIQIIDCIEFNDRFRYSDAVLDLAFLHMDLDRMGYSDWSRVVLHAYVERARDPELYTLLDFYAAYRAVVRAKVACLRLHEVEGDAADSLKEQAVDYLCQAYRYAVQFSRPTIWVFYGLPATGKSTLAKQIAEALKIPLFQSDVIRKEGQAFPHEGVVPYGQGEYRPEMRHRVYAQMLALAQDSIKSGHSAVLDATYSQRKWRDECRLLAKDLDTNIVFVECTASKETICARLAERETASGNSDARLQHLPQMIENFEASVELSPEIHLKVDTDRPFTETAAEVLSEGYAKRCAQVKQLLLAIG